MTHSLYYLQDNDLSTAEEIVNMTVTIAKVLFLKWVQENANNRNINNKPNSNIKLLQLIVSLCEVVGKI